MNSFPSSCKAVCLFVCALWLQCKGSPIKTTKWPRSLSWFGSEIWKGGNSSQSLANWSRASCVKNRILYLGCLCCMFCRHLGPGSLPLGKMKGSTWTLLVKCCSASAVLGMLPSSRKPERPATLPSPGVVPGPEGQTLQRFFSVFLNTSVKGVPSVSQHGAQLGDGWVCMLHMINPMQYLFFSKSLAFLSHIMPGSSGIAIS